MELLTVKRNKIPQVEFDYESVGNVLLQKNFIRFKYFKKNLILCFANGTEAH